MNYGFGIIDSGAEEQVSPYVTGARSISAPDPGQGIGIDDLFSAGKGLFKSFAPQAYADATSWMPSFSEIGTNLGLDGLFGAGGEVAGGAGGALGGAAAAFAPAAAFLAWAKIMSAINQNTDHPITTGYGYTSLEDGFYGGGGPKVGEAQGLSNQFLGDRSWYEGGDPSMAEDLDTSVGSMSWKKSIPAFTVGGAPYSDPRLAVSSGRQINRGQMGLPVAYETLPNGMSHGADPGLMADMQSRNALPVFDAPQSLPTDWDEWQERAQNSSYSNPSNTEAGAWAPETIQAYVGSQTPRGQEWFNTGLNTGQMYTHTGEGSPDWGAPLTDLSQVPAEMDRFRSRPTLQNYQFGALS